MSYPINITEYISSPSNDQNTCIKLEPIDLELEDINSDEDFSDGDGDIIWIKREPMSAELSTPERIVVNPEEPPDKSGPVGLVQTTPSQETVEEIEEMQKEPLDLSLPKAGIPSISGIRQNEAPRSPRAPKKRVRFNVDQEDAVDTNPHWSNFDSRRGFTQPQNESGDYIVLMKKDVLEALTALKMSPDEPEPVMSAKQVRCSERIQGRKKDFVPRVKYVDCCPSCCVPFLRAQKGRARPHCKNNSRRSVTQTRRKKKTEVAAPNQPANTGAIIIEAEHTLITEQLARLSMASLVTVDDKRKKLNKSEETAIQEEEEGHIAPVKGTPPQTDRPSHLMVKKLEEGRWVWACRCSAEGEYFRKPRSAERHVYQATRRMQYRCRVCCAAFAYSRTFNRHVRDKHPGIVFSCPSCIIEWGSLANIICEHAHV